ncbi:hypothetical protein J3A64_004734 [Pseudarthrobacter sp. PvP004]|uniref:hypothetical protein n=1 Tax=Pseudarthrobacter sp. PvP004 TaxID=2817850 RepID=UPI001AE4919A|nr:hypothetical protein [Pseudarthrobacter sp. PvP004]MBP2269194.1 hypothetical protein [Pseudarthrobacter sp. PvP004]
MTARRTPADRKATTAAPVKLSGEVVQVPSEELANEAAAAVSIAKDVQAPAVAELGAEANGTSKAPKKAPAKPAAKKEPAPTFHGNCTHAESGAEGKKARAVDRRECAVAAAAA